MITYLPQVSSHIRVLAPTLPSTWSAIPLDGYRLPSLPLLGFFSKVTFQWDCIHLYLKFNTSPNVSPNPSSLLYFSPSFLWLFEFVYICLIYFILYLSHCSISSMKRKVFVLFTVGILVARRCLHIINTLYIEWVDEWAYVILKMNLFISFSTVSLVYFFFSW